MIANNVFLERVALKTLNLLIQTKAMHYTSGTVFYVWQRGNRVIVAFDPNAIKLDRVNDRFAHDLSTRLQGRRVVRTNTRGLFLQVALETPGVPLTLEEGVALDLTQQPTPWHLPVGMTANGPLWISLTSGISFLVGGATGTGKTGEEHAWIQALLHGGKTEIYAWDGKQSVEFIRYADQPHFHLISNLNQLEQLHDDLKDRVRKLANSGHVNILDHNEASHDDFIPPIALFVDEAADLPDKVKTLLKELIRLYRFTGLYPIIATNQPTQVEMFAKTNLHTRVAFKVPHHNDSVTILGYKGAESLPDVCGRGLITWRGKLVEFQSFHVVYPPVSEEARQLATGQQPVEPAPPVDDFDATKILELIDQGETDAAIVRKVWKVSGGGRYYKLVERVKALRNENTSSSSTSTPDSTVLGLEGAG